VPGMDRIILARIEPVARVFPRGFRMGWKKVFSYHIFNNKKTFEEKIQSLELYPTQALYEITGPIG